MFKSKKSEQSSQHEAIVAIYTRNLQFKKDYFNEISKGLIQSKIEYGELSERKIRRNCKKHKPTEVVLSDLIGIQKADIHIYHETGGKPEVFLFSGMTQEFFQKVLLQIARRKAFSVNVRLFPLLPGEDEAELKRQQTRKIFASALPGMIANSHVNYSGISTVNPSDLSENSSISDFESETAYAEKKFRKVLNAGYKSKKFKRKIRDKLRKYAIPKKLKEHIYDEFVRDHNRVDPDFISALSNTERGLPRNIARLMSTNTDEVMKLWDLNDDFLAFEICDCLKLLYSYRPDLGYKTGMEVYALLLGLVCHKEKLRRIFMSVVLDYDNLFGVFKGCDTVEFDIRGRLLKGLEHRLGNKISNPDFLWHCFLFLVSNCFVNLLPREQLLFANK